MSLDSSEGEILVFSDTLTIIENVSMYNKDVCDTKKTRDGAHILASHEQAYPICETYNDKA